MTAAREEVDADSAPRAPAYAQAIGVTGATRWLFVGGQGPTRKDGSVPADFEAQAHLAWSNLIAQLDAAGMTVGNLVKVTIFLKDRALLGRNGEICDDVLAGRRIAFSTIIAGLVSEAWHVEIEGIAAA